MIRKDYHGFKLSEALRDLEQTVGYVRMKAKAEDAEIITGFGEIRSEVFSRLQEYGLNPSWKLGNNGTIVCVIE
jgi:hypothetical protein